MIPLKDENPSRTFPFITIAIIAINALVFLYELTLGEGLDGLVKNFGVIPYNLTHAFSTAIFLTLFTSLFLHGGFSHIIGNMLYLWIFGNNIEDRLGHVRFIFFYLLCGIAASFGHVLSALNSKIPTIGASGAISGVLGAYLILYPNAKILTLVPLFYTFRIIRINAKWFLLIWIVMQIFSGTASVTYADSSAGAGVAWFAHIAGFFAGILFLYLLSPKKKKRILV
jgi:membrane associated rhomboid family serine protease